MANQTYRFFRPPLPRAASVEPPRMTPFEYSDSPDVIGYERTTPTINVQSHDRDAQELYKPAAFALHGQTQQKNSKTSSSNASSLSHFLDREPGEPSGVEHILAKEPMEKAVPPIQVVEEVEHTRHGVRNSEAEYQMLITPPVRQRILPNGVEIDPNDVLTQPLGTQEVNTSTWNNSPTKLAPPINSLPMSTPGARSVSNESPYDVTRPTCSLNVVCYRSGKNGCELRQVQTVLASRFKNAEAFKKTCARNPQLISTDQRLFDELRRLYEKEMCGFWRRHFSLKTLRGLRVLAYSPVNRPTVVPFDEFVLQEMLYAYTHPSQVKTDSAWIEWVFRLRRQEQRHALELVEGWNTTRIIVAGTIPWAVSCVFGIIWAVTTKDVQGAFTIASFILTSATIVLALLAVISGIESSGRSNF
ncbi:uncharacterized protein PV09_06184 [Verruconis gallopava]|uniref:Uncharacterized protein n=1 Tax=Verruconis gallopava TaxID=253628 RepID=A0A0D1YNT4_9PEZI|nr:uncharacterized protein PV09_06184 [Verruconis gallopava]KIW02362.1 hypothetical protein PV09_06184 [Verruconis gallopava]